VLNSPASSPSARTISDTFTSFAAWMPSNISRMKRPVTALDPALSFEAKRVALALIFDANLLS